MDRVRLARDAISRFCASQRCRYADGLSSLGFELYTGDGGFYHWGRLPSGLTSDEFNARLFRHDAGILPGYLCDRSRRGNRCPLGTLIRFSFGPLAPDTYASDMEILEAVLASAGPRS